MASWYVWESKADGTFTVSEDPWNEPLGRGTEIRLHLREEAGEYLEESKLKGLGFGVSPSAVVCWSGSFAGIALRSLERDTDHIHSEISILKSNIS
ncbi:hypothetical protein RHGRI_010230 [Rhododendron griersonianum]|uniref:Uncharacterized protein n=1 Tax=Rhododendron griersonianum TaxID=479676 RepID=A0AAV6KI13_9ERIC|nr:hypothetical protein RHGRI_010230 [Rhododendron griersonianum]